LESVDTGRPVPSQPQYPKPFPARYPNLAVKLIFFLAAFRSSRRCGFVDMPFAWRRGCSLPAAAGAGFPPLWKKSPMSKDAAYNKRGGQLDEHHRRGVSIKTTLEGT
jgi:hypothetical protein